VSARCELILTPVLATVNHDVFKYKDIVDVRGIHLSGFCHHPTALSIQRQFYCAKDVKNMPAITAPNAVNR